MKRESGDLISRLNPLPRERNAHKRQRAGQVFAELQRAYPEAATELDFGTPFELLVATILSAQATDVSINAATPARCARYPDAHALAVARPERLESFIKTLGPFRKKAKNIDNQPVDRRHNAATMRWAGLVRRSFKRHAQPVARMVPTDCEEDRGGAPADEAGLLRQLRETPDLLAAVAASSPAERLSQKQLRGRYSDGLVRAALMLQEARDRAAGRFPHAERLWLTRTGLEQATAWDVARHKAARFAACDQLVDLCSGIGSDAAAASHHCQVTAIDCCPAMVLRTAWNAEVLGRCERVAVQCSDVTAGDWTGRMVHADPDRRAGRSRPARWLAAYQPGLDWMQRLASTARGGAIKLGPASDFRGKFPSCEIELTSLGGECREATVWFGELAGAAPARATNLTTGETLAGDPAAASRRLADTVERFVCDPDPALVRAGLLDLFAERNGMSRLDTEDEYLTVSNAATTGLGTLFAVEAVLPAGTKELRRYLRSRPSRSYDIKCRRLKIDGDAVHRQLPIGEAAARVIIFCRIGGRGRAIVGQRLAAGAGGPSEALS